MTNNTNTQAPAGVNIDAQALVDRMKACGWKELPDGEVIHPEFIERLSGWQEAIDACIQVASGV
jgi:hypothetical protein